MPPMLQFNTSLKGLASMEICTYLWEHPVVDHKIHVYFVRDFKHDFVMKEKWFELTHFVLKLSDVIIIPDHLKRDLKNLIWAFGEKLYNFTIHHKENIMAEDLNICAKQRIRLSPSGLLDELKIFKMFWLHENHRNVSTIFLNACSLADEELITYVWENGARIFLSQTSYSIKIAKTLKYHLVAYWIFKIKGNLQSLLSHIESHGGNSNSFYHNILSVNENMFKYSVSEGQARSVEYFWDLMNEIEKTRCIYWSMGVIHNKFQTRRVDGYLTEQYIIITKNLINKMSHIQLLGYLKDKTIDILMMFLYNWPWDKLFIKIFEISSQFISKEILEKIVFHIITKLVGDEIIGIPISNNINYKLLQEMWLKCPRDLKLGLTFKSIEAIYTVLKFSEFTILQLILNDEDMAIRKIDMLDFGMPTLRYLVLQKKFVLLSQFMAAVCSTDEEVNRFKDGLRIDDLLRLNYLKFQNYEAADGVLAWYTGTEENLLAYKENLKTDNYTFENIYEIWHRNHTNIEQSKYETLTFLSWFINEQEIPTYKRETLNQIITIFLQKNFLCHLSTYIDWCLPPGEVELFKQAVVTNTALISDEEDLDDGTLECIIRKNYVQNNKSSEFLNKFMTFNEFLLCCDHLISNICFLVSYESKMITFRKFYDVWIKDLEYMSHLKLHLAYTAFSRNSNLFEDFKLFLALFD